MAPKKFKTKPPPPSEELVVDPPEPPSGRKKKMKVPTSAGGDNSITERVLDDGRLPPKAPTKKKKKPKNKREGVEGEVVALIDEILVPTDDSVPTRPNLESTGIGGGDEEVASAEKGYYIAPLHDENACIESQGFRDELVGPPHPKPSFLATTLRWCLAPIDHISRFGEALNEAALGGDEDARLSRMVERSFEFMCQDETLDGVAVLLNIGMEVMDEFECNGFAASVFKKRLCQALICLGAPRSSILAKSLEFGVPLQKNHIYKMEGLLSVSLRYLSKFTRPDHVIYTLIGFDIRDHLVFLNDSLEHILHEMLLSTGSNDTSILMPPLQHYAVVCDLKAMVDEADDNPVSYHRKVANERNFDDTDALEFAAELEEVRAWVDDTRAVANASTSEWVGKSCGCGIRQHAFVRFWVENVDVRCISVSPTDLIECIRSYFEALYYKDGLREGDEERVATLCDEKLPRALDFVPADPADTIGASMDFFELCRLFRSIHRTEENLVTVLEMVVDVIHLGVMRVLPPLPVSEVFWESDDQEVELGDAVTCTCGWVVLSGPKYTGKSTRLLSICHNYVGETKDILWVDYCRVVTEKEAVFRTSSQLSMKGVYDLSSLTRRFSALLKSLRPGSVLVLDNLDADKLGSFISRLVQICKIVLLEKELCIVVVCTIPPPFAHELSGEHGLTVVNVVIPPLSHDRSMHMATTMKPLAVKAVLPVDPIALCVSGQNLPGLMAPIACQCSLNVMRAMAKSMPLLDNINIEDSNDEYIHIQSAIQCYVAAASAAAGELSSDERLCLLCIFWIDAPFTEPLVWAMCQRHFKADIVRWTVAWRGLLECLWIIPLGDIGYALSPLSVHCPSDILDVDHGFQIVEQDQRIIYTRYWLAHALLMFELAPLSVIALEGYGMHYHHYQSLLDMFVSNAEKAECVEEVAKSLAGHLTPFVCLYYTPIDGIAMMRCLVSKISPPTIDCVLLRGVIELVKQMRRIQSDKKLLEEGIALLKGSIAQHANFPGDLDKAKAVSLVSLLYHDLKSLSDARKNASIAYSIWENIYSDTRDVDDDFKELVSKIAPKIQFSLFKRRTSASSIPQLPQQSDILEPTADKAISTHSMFAILPRRHGSTTLLPTPPARATTPVPEPGNFFSELTYENSTVDPGIEYDEHGGYYDADGGYVYADGGYTDVDGGYTDKDGGYTDAEGGYTDPRGNYFPPESDSTEPGGHS